MKKKTIQINRRDWELLNEYKKAPFKQRYLEMQEFEEMSNLEFVE